MKKLNINWISILTIIAPMEFIGLILGYYYHKSEFNRYEEQLSPEVDCDSKYFCYIPNKEYYKFIIKNTGLIDCKNIWAQEVIYLIIDGEVYEGDGVPHFNYFVYNGSRTRMWDLERGKELEVDITQLQIEAFNKLKEKFNPTVISSWKINYSKEYSFKKYYFEEFFIFDFDDKQFKKLKDSVGGKSYENKIKNYLSCGKKMIVDIFELTGDFDINPPQAFVINPDYSFTPIYPWKKLSLEDLNNSLYCFTGRFEVQPSDDISKGTVCYKWEFENGRWEKVVLTAEGAMTWSRYIPVMAILLDKDAIRVKDNPSLLKKQFQLEICVRNEGTLEREPRKKQETIEILNKARDKYFTEKGYH